MYGKLVYKGFIKIQLLVYMDEKLLFEDVYLLLFYETEFFLTIILMLANG